MAKKMVLKISISVLILTAGFYAIKGIDQYRKLQITDPECSVDGELNGLADEWKPKDSNPSFLVRRLVFPSALSEKDRKFNWEGFFKEAKSMEPSDSERSNGILKKYDVVDSGFFAYEFGSVCDLKKLVSKTLLRSAVFLRAEESIGSGPEPSCVGSIVFYILYFTKNGHPVAWSYNSSRMFDRAMSHIRNSSSFAKSYQDLPRAELIKNSGECEPNSGDQFGIKVGRWSYFYDDGIKFAEGNYTGGKRNGEFRVFAPNGAHVTTIRFLNGVAKRGVVNDCSEIDESSCRKTISLIREFVGDPDFQ